MILGCMGMEIIPVVGGNLVCKMLILNVVANDNEKNHESELKQL